MIPVLFAHGAGAGPEDPPLPALRARLGAGYAVTAPDLGPPDPAEWTRRLAAALAALPPRALLIGHSLGGSHLLKCLAERGPARSMPRGMVGLACPLWGEPGWDVAGFALPPYAPEALDGLPIRLFHGTDDDVVPPAHLEAWTRRLPGVRTYLLPGQDHMFAGDLSAIALAVAEL